MTLAKEVLKVWKVSQYGPLVIAECHAAELPPSLAKLMLDINAYLTAKAAPGNARNIALEGTCSPPPSSPAGAGAGSHGEAGSYARSAGTWRYRTVSGWAA